MDEKLLVCPECKSTLFDTLMPRQFLEQDITVFRQNAVLKHYTAPVPILKCIKCGMSLMPPTAFVGLSVLDPAVVAYKELRDTLEYINQNRKSHSCKCSSKIDDNISLTVLQSEINMLKTELQGLKDVKTTNENIRDSEDLVPKRKTRGPSKKNIEIASA